MPAGTPRDGRRRKRHVDSLGELAMKALDKQLKKNLSEVNATHPDDVDQLPDVSVKRPELQLTWSPTPESLDVIWQLALTGCSEKTIARVGCQVTDEVYFQLREGYPELAWTIETARRTAEAISARVVINELLDRHSTRRFQAAQFYLKHKAAWSEALNSELPQLPPPDDVKQLTNDALLKLMTRKTNEVVDAYARRENELPEDKA